MVRKVSESSIPLPANDGRGDEEISGRSKLIKPKESFWWSLLKSVGEIFVFPVKTAMNALLWVTAKGIDLVNVHRKRRGGQIQEHHHSPFAQDLAESSAKNIAGSFETIAAPVVNAAQRGAAAARGYDVESGSGYDSPSRHNHQTDIPMIPNVGSSEEMQQRVSEFLIPTSGTQVSGRGPVNTP
jgi:hypothetical protein